MNTNATRFTQIFSLDFDHSGQIASASVQVREGGSWDVSVDKLNNYERYLVLEKSEVHCVQIKMALKLNGIEK